MQDRPSAEELLEFVRRFLERDVVPALDGPRRFHARVAANVLAIVSRELATEETSLRAEWSRLAALLGGAPASPPASLAALREAVRAQTTALCDRIRSGDADTGAFGGAVRDAVRASVRDKLRVANPRFVTP